MLREGRGTSATRHAFLAQELARRFPETQPAIVHRVYRLLPSRARLLFGEEVAATIPAEGLLDVHRYLMVTLHGQRVRLDATAPGPPWNGRDDLGPACGEGEDLPAGEDPDRDLRALELERCDSAAREPFLAALAAAGTPPS